MGKCKVRGNTHSQMDAITKANSKMGWSMVGASCPVLMAGPTREHLRRARCSDMEKVLRFTLIIRLTKGSSRMAVGMARVF